MTVAVISKGYVIGMETTILPFHLCNSQCLSLIVN